MYGKCGSIFHAFGQVIATSDDLRWGREIALFQKNLGWQNCIIWPGTFLAYGNEKRTNLVVWLRLELWDCQEDFPNCTANPDPDRLMGGPFGPCTSWRWSRPLVWRILYTSFALKQIRTCADDYTEASFDVDVDPTKRKAPTYGQCARGASTRGCYNQKISLGFWKPKWWGMNITLLK